MPTANIHYAKTHLSRLVEQAAKGESVIIAKAGKPIARLTALGVPEAAAIQRLGFLAGHATVPDDFDDMGAQALEAMFAGLE